MKRKGILLNNAWSAWRRAIYYADLIYDGRSSFDNRKSFVSALHNSVELFLKQIMLNKNDHRVVFVRKCKDAECKQAKDYYASQDLNTFFKELEPENRDSFASIEFNKFIELHRDILSEFLQKDQNFTSELKKLKNLRNDETHFFADVDSYLTESEFMQLYNFMVIFNEVVHKYHLLPFFGRGATVSKFSFLEFDRKKLVSFSYRDALIHSEKAKQIEKCANGMQFDEYEIFMPSGAYETALAIYMKASGLETLTFDELLEYVTIMFSFKMIKYLRIKSYDEPRYSPENGEYEGMDKIDVFSLSIHLS